MRRLRFGLLLLVSCLFLNGCGCEKEKSFTVTFNTNGGSVVDSQTVKENGLVTKPTDPTKEGYTFSGWYLNEKLFDFSTKVTKDLTLEAGWGTKGNNKGITLNTTKTSIVVDKSATIKVTLSDNIKKSDLIWKSSDESIAKVDASGKVTALKAGTAVITVSTKDGSYSATCKITVDKKAALNVTISGSKNVEVGKSATLTAKVTPKDTTLKSTIWKSSNTSVATVSDKGVVTGVSAGNSTISVTVTDKDGNTKAASVKVTITSPVTDEPKPPVTEEPVVEVKKYTVTFDSKDGSSVPAQTVEEGKTANKPSSDKTGYVLDGWYLDGSKYNFSSKVTKDITLVAKWIPIYTVTLNPVDTGSPTGDVYQYTVSVTEAGSSFNSYQYLTIDGSIKYVKGTGYMAASKVKGVGSESKVVITLSDGSTVSANLIK